MTQKVRLLLHIGTQKTGTSSLQQAMRNERQHLLQCGILYPDLRRGKHPFKHLSVSRAAKSSDAALQDAEYQALLREFRASGAHTMILSEESLWRAKVPFRVFFARFRADFRVEIVVSLRRPDLYIESLYNQALRTGQPDEHRTIVEFWRDETKRGRIAYHQRLAEWAEVADQVHVLEFDRQVKSGGLISSFFRALDLTVEPPLAEIVAKKSPDNQYMMAVRCLRGAGIPFDESILEGVGTALGDVPELNGSKYLLGRRERSALLADCRTDVLALQRDYGITFSDKLPAEGEEPVTEPSTAYLLAALGWLTRAATTAQMAQGQGDEPPASAAEVEPERPGRARRRARKLAERLACTTAAEQGAIDES